MDISPTALVNASTQMQQSQVAKTAQVLVLTKAMDYTGHRGAGAATGPGLGTAQDLRGHDDLIG
jgi:hypothetical protein